MLIIKTLSLLRQHIRRSCQEGRRVALVPAMDNLHNGHMKLVDGAKARANVVFVSTFVNPMQFDRPDGLVRYPRTLQKDCEKPNKRKVDYASTPVVEEIYPQDLEGQTFVDAPDLSTVLEGASHPGHFRDVLAIVNRLFNLARPDIAYFGEKDFQQLVLIRKMTVDMGYDIEIVGIPIIRVRDGLALGSYDGYLTTEQRKIASGLYNVMNGIAEKLIADNHELQEIITITEQELNEKGLHADNIQTRDADTLLELIEASKRAVILAMTWLGQTHLTSNQSVTLAQQVEVKDQVVLPENFSKQTSRVCSAEVSDRVQKSRPALCRRASPTA